MTRSMSRYASSRTRRSGSALLSALLLLSLAGPAVASPDTLRVAIEDIVFGAVDVAAAPVTGGIATARNLDSVSDNGLLQGLYAVPGWLGLTTLQLAQGTLRVATGAIQLVPGIVLFPFETDVPDSFNVFRSGDKLVDLRNPLAEKPPWLRWVPPVTPFTIDCRLAPISPWAVYQSADDQTAGDTGDLSSGDSSSGDSSSADSSSADSSSADLSSAEMAGTP